jgi:hypothetical protein
MLWKIPATCALLLCLGIGAGAQESSSQSGETPPEVVTTFPHSENNRWWIAGQMNFIFQAHPDFQAKYSGPNSFHSNYEKATSRLMTLYTGFQVTDRTDLLMDVESAGGRGLSDALGIAGFTNLDVVRNPSLGSKPYLARILLNHTISMSKGETDADRTILSLARKVPVRRVEFWIGKFSTVDFFDVNTYEADSHLQFLNWTVDNNGAYDYAADTRGYTVGAVVQYQDRNWALRFGEVLMPQVANGMDLEYNLRRARAENVELEFRRSLVRKRSGAVRFLSYVNHANMGVYRQAIEQFRAGETEVPDITAHPRWTKIKYGFGVNWEQEIADSVALFGRYGWNNGKTESFAYTEVDNTVSFGVRVRGLRGSRPQDRTAAAFVSNWISTVHQEYLALGGQGFLLGDGGLNHGRENIIESYHRAHLGHGIYIGPDVQYIVNPGYNRDRGPVVAPGFRVHVEL